MIRVRISDVFAIVILLSLFYFIVQYFFSTEQNRKELEKNKKFTIGITGNSFGASHGSTIEYFYSVDGVKYRKTQSLKGKVNYPNSKYLVQFSSVNPKNSIILFSKPIGVDTIESPENGWDSISVNKIFPTVQ